MADDRCCPRCGQSLPPDVPTGTCPACLLRAGLGPASSAAPLGGSDDDEVTFGFEPTHPGHVLEGLARSIGSIPRVLLPDTAIDDAGVAVIKPSSSEMPAPNERGERYQLFGEIARGGMGAVLKGRDTDLGRDLAVKVLLESHQHKPDMVRRFVEEAQIGGQLQHPGIVPVYELGAFSDRRPYFTMKLVKGRTLSALLAERQSLAHDLPRFLSIFEAICQTMAYAHARGVIHRDLKPSNVMVGSFGEVQVMDWGLAKVMKEGGLADEPPAQPAPEVSVIATVRSGSDADESQPGSVLGTPAYMAPEQAAGEVERVDRRADVFGLGSILCEILTGQPAYIGKSQPEVIRKAMRGDTADALTRLAGSAAEGELVSLAKDCLAVEPLARPLDAAEVAGAITAHLSGVQERVRAAELAKVAAQARADEERKRRKLTVALAASILLLMGVGGLAAFAYQRQVIEAAGRVEVARGQAIQRLEAAREAWSVRLDPSGYDRAVEAAEDVESLLTGRLSSELRGRVRFLADATRSEAAAARADREWLDKLTTVRAARYDSYVFDAVGEYGRLFGDLGVSLDNDSQDLSALAAALRGPRPKPIVVTLASLLDDWALLLRTRLSHRPLTDRVRQAERVTALARALDPDAWRNNLRAELARPEANDRREALLRLAEAPDVNAQPATTLTHLAAALIEVGEAPKAVELLEPARWRHRDDPWVFLFLGQALRAVRPPRNEDALRAFTAATMLQPASGVDLASALEDTGRTAEAIVVLEDLIDRRPDAMSCYLLGEMQNKAGRSAAAKRSFGRSIELLRQQMKVRPRDVEILNLLGLALSYLGDAAGAIAAYEEAIRLDPKLAWLHYGLGLTRHRKGDLKGAITALREALRLNPSSAKSYTVLGISLHDSGDLPGAIAAHRKAIELKPDLVEAHDNLGNALDASGDRPAAIAAYRKAIQLKPDYANAYSNLGAELLKSDDLPGAIAALRDAIRVKPDHTGAHFNLGVALLKSGNLPGAIAAYQKVIELKPDEAMAYYQLGIVLRDSGDLAGAIAAYRRVIELKPSSPEAHPNFSQVVRGPGDIPDPMAAYPMAIERKPNFAPDYAMTHFSLGNVLRDSGDLPGAIAAFRQSIELKPDYAEAHCNLGLVLTQTGNFDDALVNLRRGHELGSKRPDWRYPSAQWVAQAERMRALSKRFPAVLRGGDKPNDNPERLVFAQMAYDHKHFSDAARLWAEALGSDPKLGEDRAIQARYNAACAAALAGAGQGNDKPPPDETAKAKLRGQALEWLKAELTAWGKLIESGPPQARPAIVQTLKHWRKDSDLAGIRGPDALAKLPAEEQRAWRTLWTEVDALSKKARDR